MIDSTHPLDATHHTVGRTEKVRRLEMRRRRADCRPTIMNSDARRAVAHGCLQMAAIFLLSMLPGRVECAAPGGLAPAAFTEPIVDEAEARMGAGFIVGLIVFAAATTAWRTLLGRDRTKADVRIESDFITRTELDTRLEGLASEIERKFERALHEEFRLLNGERSRSIGNLHEKIETTADGLRAELNEVRAIVIEMPGRVVAMLRGRVKEEG